MKKKREAIAVLAILLALTFACSTHKDRFQLIDPERSNVDFNNKIFEDDSFNIIEYGHIYNGGGVAIADFNNDGRQDLYFTGNMVSNKLYLNNGNFDFDDVTEASNAGGEEKWCYGVAVVDINNDGFKDIYIAVTANPDSIKRENILYINNGLNKQGIPQFKDMAKEYGINDNSHTTNAAFFDYDNDGDLDLYLLTNKIELKSNSRMSESMDKSAGERVDKLYKNEWSNELGHAFFHDVSSEAGIKISGYGLGLNISDLNQDGWKDIYVTNDYSSQDLTYINQKNGTFKNLNNEYFKHISFSAMGCDVVDFNNDGYPDVFALDMLPEDNLRKKTMVPANNYSSYMNRQENGYQFVRNTLQVNQGVNPETGYPIYSDIGIFAGIAETDWSWAPLVADFDNDGLRDLIVTNGFPKDVTDRDYLEFAADRGQFTPNKMLIPQIPSVKLRNYAFRNAGDATFRDVTEDWGIHVKSFSNGAAYGDLDNDGDLDYVVNNINDKAFIYKNLTNDNDGEDHNWLKISLKGNDKNIDALGTIIKVYVGDQVEYWEHSPYRGYLSSMDENIVFGLGPVSTIDSIRIFWPSNKTQKVEDVKANQHLIFDIKDARETGTGRQETSTDLLFSDHSQEFSEIYARQERDFNDFNIQPLLPHKLSDYGPGVSVGDVNGDGLEDIYVSGANFFNGQFLIQQQEGTFKNEDLLTQKDGPDKLNEEMGTLLFDADQDGDLDLYLVSGSYEFPLTKGDYQDKLYRNVDGKFELADNALPQIEISGSCVKAADFDRDGDLDLFIGGRVQPYQYPKPVDSYILVNESTNSKMKFEKADPLINDQFKEIGMVTDALWTDFDNDQWVDLIVVGEWMSIRFFKNEHGKLKDISDQSGVSDKTGWWNSIAAGDFDNDGDMDYIAGNLGLNSLFKGTEKYPLTIYAADFNHDEKYDAIPFSWFKNQDGGFKEFPFFGRIDYQKQVPEIRTQFITHAEFGRATAKDIFTAGALDSAYILKANYMSSAFIENMGDGSFQMRPLPLQCQWAPVYAMNIQDFDADGNEDVLIVGNDFGTESLTGKYDALNGMILLGDGNGGFELLPTRESGIYIPTDAKTLVRLTTEDGSLFIATPNRGSLEAFENPSFDRAQRLLTLRPDDFKISFTGEDGKIHIREVYYGNSFLSQSSRKTPVPQNVAQVEVINFKGEKRIVNTGSLALKK